MGLRAGLDWCPKSRPTGIRSPDCPARRQSLYRLSYPAHSMSLVVTSIKRAPPLCDNSNFLSGIAERASLLGHDTTSIIEHSATFRCRRP